MTGLTATESLECPFETRLYRTPYLVLPKLAIQAMPMSWRRRLDALLQEAEDAGLVTPCYKVLRDHDMSPPGAIKDIGTFEHPFLKIIAKPDDPWADYRRGDVKELCPTFVRPE